MSRKLYCRQRAVIDTHGDDTRLIIGILLRYGEARGFDVNWAVYIGFTISNTEQG